MEKLKIDDTLYETRYTKKFLNRKKYIPKNPKHLTAHIPGVINEVSVKNGQKVKRGDALLILEAMKMKNHITSPIEGTINTVLINAGDMVTKNQILIEFK